MSENNYYRAKHELTENYIAGMSAMMKRKPDEALALLLNEPADSPCCGLALANAALAFRLLDRFDEAIDAAERSLEQFADPGCPHLPTAVQALQTLADAVASKDVISSPFPSTTKLFGLEHNGPTRSPNKRRPSN